MQKGEQEPFSAKANLLVKDMQGLKPGISPKQVNKPKRAQANPNSKTESKSLGAKHREHKEKRGKKCRDEGTYGA